MQLCTTVPKLWMDEDNITEILIKYLLEENALQMKVLFEMMPCVTSFMEENGVMVRGVDKKKVSEFMPHLIDMDSEDFRKDLRINKETYMFILKELRPCVDRFDYGPGKPRISSVIQIACTLW